MDGEGVLMVRHVDGEGISHVDGEGYGCDSEDVWTVRCR